MFRHVAVQDFEILYKFCRDVTDLRLKFFSQRKAQCFENRRFGCDAGTTRIRARDLSGGPSAFDPSCPISALLDLDGDHTAAEDEHRDMPTSVYI